jgi:hypothetical protein
MTRSVSAQSNMTVGDAHGQIVEADEFAITAPILEVAVIAGVPGFAIALDHESITDEQVDVSNSRNPHLHRHPDTPGAQPQPNDRLDAGLAPRIRTIEGTRVPPRRMSEGPFELAQ